ncbi:MAG: hypothetical protein AAB263_13420 [Planctomycetota bacterium]
MTNPNKPAGVQGVHTPTPWKAAIWRHSGQPDTVCIKDAQGREIIGWNGFDGVPCTKAEIRANAHRIVTAVNCHDALLVALKDLLANLTEGDFISEARIDAATAAIQLAEAR